MKRTIYSYRTGAGKKGRAYAAGISKLLERGHRLTVQREDRVPARKVLSGARIVAIAMSKIGVVEQPVGSNTGTQVQDFQDNTNVPGTRWPWCQAFVRWTLDEAGVLLDGYRGAYVPHFETWARVVGRWHDGDDPLPGWAIVFGGTGHVGIVEKVGRGGQIHTIEGNASDRVKRMTYQPTDPRIRGYVKTY